MPCRDYYDEPSHAQAAALAARNDQLARMLCTTLRTMTFEQISKLPKEVREWWSQHQIDDLKRNAAAKANKLKGGRKV